MAVKNKSWILLILAFFLVLSISIEAQELAEAPELDEELAEAPDPEQTIETPEQDQVVLGPTPAPNGELGPIPRERILKSNVEEQNVVTELKEVIPRGEEYLILMRQRIDETPLSSPAEKCLRSCFDTYEKEIADLKKFVNVLSTKPAAEVDFETTVEKDVLQRCDGCLREVAREDPEFNKYTEWFYKATEKIAELINKYNS